MNIEATKKLSGVIELLLETSNRINEAKPRQYWYPLSLATYGVEEILEAVDCMCSFRTTMWEKTLKFERRFAEYLGASASVMVNSGSSADLLASFLLTNPRGPRLKPGDEVLVPAVTWPTHVWSPMMAGLKVRLVDVDPETLNVSIEDIERKITPATKALFIVHLMGNPCDMTRIMKLCKAHNLILLEDCCEALGAEWLGKKVGTFGLAGTFSFFFSHHMSTMEGGALSTMDEGLADELRILRAHGWLRNSTALAIEPAEGTDPRYTFVNWGFNLRPTELQAGFGLHQLLRLPEFNLRRQQLAERFFEFALSLPYIRTPKAAPEATPAWFSLPMVIGADAPFDRQELTGFLERNGIETRPIVAGSIARQPAAKLFENLMTGELRGADLIHDNGFYIGLTPLTTDADMDRLTSTFEEFFAVRAWQQRQAS